MRITHRPSFCQVGDGTTTVVLLASEFMKEAKPYVEDGVHPHSLIRSYRIAGNMVCDRHYFSFFLMAGLLLQYKFPELILLPEICDRQFKGLRNWQSA
jgi:hypothetical protein